MFPGAKKKTRLLDGKEKAKVHPGSTKLGNSRVENVAWWGESSFPGGPIRAWSKQHESVDIITL